MSESGWRRPVVIIGAARSGTNMLRDVLTGMPEFTTWPCDEINYIWRHGNRTWPDDELTAAHATPAVASFVTKSFRKLCEASGGRTVVEKTCANSLRVSFVHEICPEARYLFLVRDGVDVLASALQRWRAPMDLGYLLAKARYVPVTDVPYYGSRYLRNRLSRLRNPEKRLATWGPRFAGMDDALSQRSLPEVVALQWRRSVESASEALSSVASERTLRLRYEDFVNEPEVELRRVLDFLQVDWSPECRKAIAGVSNRSVGQGRRKLRAEVRDQVGPIIDPVLLQFGYAAA